MTDDTTSVIYIIGITPGAARHLQGDTTGGDVVW